MIHLLSLVEKDDIVKNEVVLADCSVGVVFNKEVFCVKTVNGRDHVLSVLNEKRDKPICECCLIVFRTRRLRPPLLIGISE